MRWDLNKHFAANLLENLTVKTIENWLRINRVTIMSLVSLFGIRRTLARIHIWFTKRSQNYSKMKINSEILHAKVRINLAAIVIFKFTK